MDGETITIDKCNIIFTLTQNTENPKALLEMKKNEFPSLHGAKKEIPGKLTIYANSKDISTFLIDLQGYIEEVEKY
jgi:hypothetical protein